MTIFDVYMNDVKVLKGYTIVNGIYVHNSLLDKFEQKIYRYTSFEYLLDIIRKGQIYVSNRANFEDKRERGAKKNLGNTFPLDMVYSPEELQEGESTWSYHLWDMSHHSCVSCWTYGNFASETNESYLMWKAYACGDNIIGCRIGTNIRSLIESIKATDDVKLIVKGVEYIGKERIADNIIEHYIFEKEAAYSDENELRLCILKEPNKDSITGIKSYPNPYQLKVDAEKLIQEIVISPFVTKNYAQFHIEQFKSSFPDYTGVIRESDILIKR